MNRAEILRYLRTSSNFDNDFLLALIDECCNEINECIVPKTLHRIFDCTVTDSELIIDNVVFKSKRLANNLRNCTRVCVFGATLGTECDRLLRAYSTANITKAVVMQACLASKIEEVCDSLEDELRATGLTLRQRFSPGYFDLDISENKKVFDLLELKKRIGLTLTDTYQMIPTKSVTAFIGVEND